MKIWLRLMLTAVCFLSAFGVLQTGKENLKTGLSASRVSFFDTTKFRCVECSIRRSFDTSSFRYVEFWIPRILDTSNFRYVECSIRRSFDTSNFRYIEFSIRRIFDTSKLRYVEFSICRNVDGDVEFDMSIVVTSGIPLSHLPMQLLLLKCS